MHIALVRRFCSLKKAGAERHCVNLFRGLQRLGHRVTIVGEGIDDELRSEVDFLPVPVVQLNSWTKNRSFAFNVPKVVQSQPFDVVHGLSRVEGLDTYRLTDPMQTHWVKVWYRNPVTRWLQHWNPRHRAVFDLEWRLFRPEGVRKIIVQSRLDARLLQEYFRVDESRIVHIVNGVDASTFNPSARLCADSLTDELSAAFDRQAAGQFTNNLVIETPPATGFVNPDAYSDILSGDRTSNRAPMLVFASMDFRRKGLDSLLAAMSQLKHQETRLLVLGDGNIAGYRRMATSLGIQNRVLFAGRQSSMQRFYGAADLFVLPTVYEPFPNVNLEAMACGTPVITTATAGGADIINEGSNGYLIPDAWSVNALAERIDHHLSLSMSEKNRMARACWQTASQLKTSDNARKVAAVLEEVASEKRSQRRAA